MVRGRLSPTFQCNIQQGVTMLLQLVFGLLKTVGDLVGSLLSGLLDGL